MHHSCGIPLLLEDGRRLPAVLQCFFKVASGQARQSGLLVALEQYYRAEVPKQKLAEQVTAGVYVTDLDLWRAWQDRKTYDPDTHRAARIT